jgi:glycerol-3-phosphate acyltransferase PlsY
VLTPLLGWWFNLPFAYNAAILAMVVLLIWRHRSNIRNLLAGAEDKIGTDRPEG